jgi:hypothetical protein
VRADLREGLGPAGRERFDIYLGTFGIASHVAPDELRALILAIAATATPGAVVGLEALGLWSLEWPALWDEPPGPDRSLGYRLGDEVSVHPWSAGELRELFEDAGLRYLGALDRTVQAGPKAGDARYWPGVPPLRAGFQALLSGNLAGGWPLAERLPPLPAHPAARAHHALAAARRALLARSHGLDGPALARAVWRLESGGGCGLGHGVLAVGRVR